MSNSDEDQPLPSKSRDGPTLRDYLKHLDDSYSSLRHDFKDWRFANQEDKKGIYRRLSDLEDKATFMPNAEEAELLKEVAQYYRAKRKLRERIYGTLMEKGVTGVVLFLLMASFFYIKYILVRDS